MTSTVIAFSAALRRLARAALFAAAVTLASAACPAVATAEPVWDVEEYDYCMRQTGGVPPGSDPIAQEEENDRYCCHRSGGVWNGITCAAPPAEAADAGQPPSGPRVGLPTVRVEPPIVAPPNPPVVGPTVAVLPPSAG